MRNIKVQPSPKKKLPIVISLVVLLILATLSALYLFKLPPFQNTNDNQSTDSQLKEERETNSDQKDQFLDSEKGNEAPTTPAEVPTSSDTINLTSSQNGNSVTVITKLIGQGYSSGECELTIRANGKTDSQTADIIYQPEYSSCAGFTTPVETLGKGVWQISLKVTPINGTPLIKTSSITVK